MERRLVSLGPYPPDKTPVTYGRPQRWPSVVVGWPAATTTMTHRCCGNSIHGPPMSYRPAAAPHRWPTDAVSTTTATRTAIPPAPLSPSATPAAPAPRLASAADPRPARDPVRRTATMAHGCVSAGVRRVPDGLARAPGALWGGFTAAPECPRCPRPGWRAALNVRKLGNAGNGGEAEAGKGWRTGPARATPRS